MDTLPNEILIKILGYLNTYDLIQFCNAFKDYSCFLKEKNIARLTELPRRFELNGFNLHKFITTNLDFHYIQVLNINYLYWVPVQDLRRLLKKLDNLEVLLALDTKLGMREKDIIEYVRLKKLAVSVEESQFDHASIVASKNLTGLKSLCLKVCEKKDEFGGLYLFFREVKQLEELWISDEDESIQRKINYGQLAVCLKKLQKFAIKSKTVLPFYDFSYSGLSKVFECKRCKSASEVVFEKISPKSEGLKRSLFEPMETEIEKSWEVFESLHKDTTCGPKDSKLIYLKEDLKNIYFEDLNFCHAVILCNTKYIDAALQILASKNSTKLKRLSFRACLFQTTQNFKEERVIKTFKKAKRTGVQTKCTENHRFQSIAENMKNLRELEIFHCLWCNGGEVMSAYPLIAKFEKLQKLTLEIPRLLDGSFFKEVFMKCEYLESLNLTCTTQNEKFIITLCQNLKYAKLRDFRLEHKQMVIDKVFNGLSEMANKPLLRIFLKCDEIRWTSLTEKQQFINFMENNPQLIFFFLVIGQNTIKQNSEIQHILNSFKEGNPAKIFYVKKDNFCFSGIFPIPCAHHDIIFNYTNVSVINLDDF